MRGKRMFMPPRKLKLFQEKQQIPRNLPPRLLENRREKQQIPPRNLPPRLLRRRQQEQAQPIFRYAISSIARQMHVENQPCRFDLIMFQRVSMQRFLMLQQQAVMMEKEFRRVQEEQKKMEERASMERFVMLQQQQEGLMMENEFCVIEGRKKIKEEENLAEEICTADYTRLTSFLEKDDSFLTPWSWKPEEKQRQPTRTDPYFSFNVLERWASEKRKDIETTCN